MKNFSYLAIPGQLNEQNEAYNFNIQLFSESFGNKNLEAFGNLKTLSKFATH